MLSKIIRFLLIFNALVVVLLVASMLIAAVPAIITDGLAVIFSMSAVVLIAFRLFEFFVPR